jgi:hypothetical protein
MSTGSKETDWQTYSKITNHRNSGRENDLEESFRGMKSEQFNSDLTPWALHDDDDDDATDTSGATEWEEILCVTFLNDKKNALKIWLIIS